LNLALVSITLLIGYIAIIISGLIFGKVSYIVTYTLTAVLLGITTDYVVFVVYRYRSELRRGKGRECILKEPIKNSVKTVLISGVTVAVSLGMFGFIGNFETWGSVLFISIIITVVMIVTTMPAILSYITPKYFMKKGLAKETEIDIAFSYFYKTSKVSTEKSAIVILVILVLAIPSILFFVTVPTTYNFNAGLSQDLSSVQGLNHLDSYFGENVLYPTYVLVPLSNHNVSSSQDRNMLIGTARYLLSYSGTKEVIGPYSNGTAISSNMSISQFLTSDNKYAFFIVYTNYSPYSSQAISYTQTLRDNKTLLVGGLTSGVIDQQAQNNRDFTELAILISVSVFVVLAVSFRNVKYPIISLSGVFISISWAVSILYLISTYLLHQAIIYLIPVILFVILMSLGNDYSVFIISRVREEQARYGNVEGINRGLQSSGKIVTSLGLILAGSLGALGLIPVSFLEQMGIAFIVSLVIDTFVIRVFYFPAMMKVLKANFK
jgi:RND superfamily putative drug exporter